ncbi:MAG: hypothetical protein H7X99_01580 [Saprospiraceae bacterium]|nr:hypothetical protein [Saprospiraceae bacterium]
MNFSKLPSIIKLILLKIIEEIERRINEKRGVDGEQDNFAESVFNSLKFIVLDQVDEMVDDVVGFVKKQINDLTTIVAQKSSVIFASLVYVLILVGLLFFAFAFFGIALSIYLGEIFGNYSFGFLTTGVLTLILVFIMSNWGRKSILVRIKNQLLKSIY